MEQRWTDYYSILEVNQQAARDDIERQYRSLCKTYHPDINHSPDAEGRMKMINLAWEVLKDDVKRRAYHREWMVRNRLSAVPASSRPSPVHRPQQNRTASPPDTLESRRTISQYFRGIMQARYGDVYGLLSERDRRNIPPESFARWQRSVAATCRIEHFLVVSTKRYDRFPMDDLPGPAIRYTLEITERDRRTREGARYRMVKFVVKEEEGWRVYLGYRDIEYVVDQFSLLAGSGGETLKRNTDPFSGLPNRLGFLDKSRGESYRCERYGRSCAVGVATVQFGKDLSDKELRYRIVQQTAFSLRATVRLIDLVGSLEDGRFCVLLAETQWSEAERAARRIAGKVEQDVLACFDTPVTLSFALEPYEGGDLESALRRCERKRG